ncbi:hypothetical protein [Pseudaquabacterium pictum]|uniref:Uncharacterized protein n=1 Tax=Pseudaquabacterium pictum TaxID=2315236 RepID=A0A480ASG7_9BURK|nr:hypothetical protein [Rubrivivax pictus]GCL64363.1 hypothetical protein AQPW35_34440 [Rubrivivax pictus]
MTQAATPTTRNEGWGFWGTMTDRAAAAWPLAVASISAATGEDAEAAATFLDSRHGRHFADELLNQLGEGGDLAGAIERTTSRFMAWKIGRATSLRTGIPRGLPYLLGHVINEQVNAEAVAA